MIQKKMKWALSVLAVASLLSACGGGGDAGAPKYTSLANAGTNEGLASVSTGKVTQKGISISVSDFAPDWSFDGSTSTITVRLVDTAGNPVPAGVKVQFSASGGAITKFCTTGTITSGESAAADSTGCSVTLTTQQPKPVKGLVAVVAWVVGEEAYYDSNSNGRYDAGEKFFEGGELFRDDDADDVFTLGVDGLRVSSVDGIGNIGVGSSACVRDPEAAPRLRPLSVDNTCDGVWGPTLVRAHAYLSVADPRRLGIDLASTVPGATSSEVFFYTESIDGSFLTMAPTGSTLTVSSAGCTPTVTPETVNAVGSFPTSHIVNYAGCTSGDKVLVTGAFGNNSTNLEITVP
jgi:hypothetical protein